MVHDNAIVTVSPIAVASTRYSVYLPAATPPQRRAAGYSLAVLDTLFEGNWTVVGEARWHTDGTARREPNSGRLYLQPVHHGEWMSYSDHHLVVVSHCERLSDIEAAEKAAEIEDYVFAAYFGVSISGRGAGRAATLPATSTRPPQPYQKLIWVEFVQAAYVLRDRPGLDGFFT